MIKNLLRKHWAAVLLAVVIGLIMIAPHIIFALKLGDAYRGIYIMQTDSEAVYMARMQEIIDGHPTLGAVPYAEYKDRPPLLPPNIIDFIMAGISMIFNIPLPILLLAAKAILPPILFLLIYWLTLEMCTGLDYKYPARLTALGAASAILLAYDFTGLWGNIMAVKSVNMFLLWSRPVNPILGALLLMSLAILLWRNRDINQIKPKFILVGSIIFALSISSYFFTWGFALAFMSCWTLIQFIGRKRYLAYSIILIVIIGFIFASPYLYQTRLAAAHPDFAYAAAKIGLSHSRAPIGSNIITITAVILVLAVYFRRKLLHENWWLFSVALTLGGIVALNQQVITRVTIWPFHFIQYIKPFSVIIVLVSLFYIGWSKFPRLFQFFIVLIISGSLMLGIVTQVATYRNSFAWYTEYQRYGDVFQWLNNNASLDCTVLAQDGDRTTFMFWIPAFTHCNSVVNANNHYLLPPERVYQEFLIILRMRGVTANGIGAYLAENHDRAIVHLYGVQTDNQIADEYREKQLQDAILARVEREYPAFLHKDFLTELRQHKIDYIIADGGLRADLIRALHLSLPIITVGGVAVYSIPSSLK